MEQGIWNGSVVMNDADYFNAMVTPSQSLNNSYGYLWWLNGQSNYMVPGLQVVIWHVRPQRTAGRLQCVGQERPDPLRGAVPGVGGRTHGECAGCIGTCAVLACGWHLGAIEHGDMFHHIGPGDQRIAYTIPYPSIRLRSSTELIRVQRTCASGERGWSRDRRHDPQWANRCLGSACRFLLAANAILERHTDHAAISRGAIAYANCCTLDAMIRQHSINSSSRITNGGAKRMMSP